MLTKIKNWIIHLFGGFTEQELENKLDEKEKLIDLNEKCLMQSERNLRSAKNKIEYWKDKYYSFFEIMKTVQSEIKLSDRFYLTENNAIEKARSEVVWQLGEAVYPFAKHRVADGVYIAKVEVVDYVEAWK